MMDMMGKLQEMQQQMDELKKKLDTITVDAEAGNGKIKVTSTANRSITNISIDDSLLQPEKKEELEDLLTVATNRALEEAEKVADAESRSIAAGMLPNMPGMPGMGGNA